MRKLFPRRLAVVAMFGLVPLSGLRPIYGQELPAPTRAVVYKKIGDTKLKLQIFEPKGMKAGERYPAAVFFFGGGWTGGKPEQFYATCARLASRGMIAMAADYRVASRQHTSPKECVMDGKSCLRYLETHSEELHIDPARLVAGGGSAGGHVALAADMLPGLNEPGEDASLPIKLAGLVLFNPVFDNGPGGYGYDRVKDYYQEISPLHNLRAGIPPMIAMFGTKDKLVPVATAEKFQAESEKLGNRCEIIFYAGQPHGFFNSKPAGNVYYDQTMAAAETFLRSIGVLPKS